MTKKLLTTVLLFVSITFSALSQKNSSKILFTIDNEQVYADEFLAIYRKNRDIGQQLDPKSPEEYLRMYIDFKLKVKEARTQGLDTSENYRNEFNTYRASLAKPYFVDNTVNEALVQEAYQRMQKDIRAGHIMLELPQNAGPSDTLKVYNEIMKLRQDILAGKITFEEAAQKYSKDTYSARQGGDLGFFTVFNMVYPFETAAYNTPIGQISLPIRTQFGYHLVKKYEERPARGQVEVAHIMISVPQNADSSQIAEAEKKIYEIFERIKNFESFEALARQYSDDKASGRNGGKLPPFGINVMVKEFEDKAFSLSVPSTYTEPFRTQYGFHIVQLIKKYPIPSFEDARKELEVKIQRDGRGNLSREAVLERLKRENNYQDYPKNINAIAKFLKPAYLKNEWNPENYDRKMKKPIFTFAGKTFKQSDLIDFMLLNQAQDAKSETLEREVWKNFHRFVETYIFSYEDSRLEEKYPEFRYLVNEYRDGILLFEIMEKEVWGKAIKDSIGLNEFFRNNQSKYQWKERMRATIVKVTTDAIARQVEKELKRNVPIDTLAARFNKINPLEISFEKGIFERGTNHIIDSVWGKKGLNKLVNKEDDRSVFVIIQEYLPAGPKTFEETRGIVITDYQNYLEKVWLESLRKKYTVTLNQEVFDSIVKEL
ncbi:MAG: peptidylprolyl isomerase [Thermaurantimonas sp.]|uniref:peptidylprolyl isomerase n=1 Tax=Thermaurantimonas sp. TaxID=2681568 RepID=UPI003918E6AF